MKKTALIIMILTIIIKLLGFARDITLSFFYGASNISDIYLVSITIPTVIFEFIGIGITTSYIPIFSQIQKQNDEKYSNIFTSNVINTIIVFCTIIVFISVIFAAPIVKIFASGFKGETLNLAIIFTRIAIVGVYFSGIIFVLNSYLQVKNNFIIPALMGVPLNILIMVSIFIGAKFNNIILPIGIVIATGIQMVGLLTFLYKKGYRYSYTFNIHDINIKKIIRLALPVILGMCINQINVLVDKTFASSLTNGGISAITYANKLILFIQGIFALSVSTAIFPDFSKMVAEKKIRNLKESIFKALSYINIFVVPATVGVMIFAEPIVKFLFGRGAFSDNAINITYKSLFFYSIGIVAFGNREILSRVFYSLQDIKTPTINASICFVLNILLNIFLSERLGIGGLALATSISAIVCTILLFLSMKKRIGSFIIKDMFFSFIKVVFASLVMGICIRTIYSQIVLTYGLGFSLILSIFLGVVIYFIIICVLKVEETNNILKYLKRKLNNTTNLKIKRRETN